MYVHAHMCVHACKYTEKAQLSSVHVEETITAMQVRNKNARDPPAPASDQAEGVTIA